MPASRLRLPQRERGLRRSLCGRGRRLRRAAAGPDACDGAQELRQGADAEGRRTRGSRLSRRQPEPKIPEGEGLRTRLSRADQGDRRRRRPGHAPNRRARRFRRRLRGGDARGARGVRRSARADREIHPAPTPYRSAGVRRPAWPGRAPLRARLLVAAPPSEGDRGEPGAGSARVEAGDAVTPFYDSMIAKLIAHAPTREAALAKLNDALARAIVIGPKTNLEFLGALLTAPEVAAGVYDTGFIDANLARLGAPPRETEPG